MTNPVRDVDDLEDTLPVKLEPGHVREISLPDFALSPEAHIAVNNAIDRVLLDTTHACADFAAVNHHNYSYED